MEKVKFERLGSLDVLRGYADLTFFAWYSFSRY